MPQTQCVPVSASTRACSSALLHVSRAPPPQPTHRHTHSTYSALLTRLCLAQADRLSCGMLPSPMVGTTTTSAPADPKLRIVIGDEVDTVKIVSLENADAVVLLYELEGAMDDPGCFAVQFCSETGICFFEARSRTGGVPTTPATARACTPWQRQSQPPVTGGFISRNLPLREVLSRV